LEDEMLLYSKVAEGYTRSAWSYESKLEACRSFLAICFWVLATELPDHLLRVFAAADYSC